MLGLRLLRDECDEEKTRSVGQSIKAIRRLVRQLMRWRKASLIPIGERAASVSTYLRVVPHLRCIMTSTGRY